MIGCTKLTAIVVLGLLIGFCFGVLALFIPGMIWGAHQ